MSIEGESGHCKFLFCSKKGGVSIDGVSGHCGFLFCSANL